MARADLDQYLRGVLNGHAVVTGLLSPVPGVRAVLDPILATWSGQQLVSITPSGSFSKGTAVQGGTDIDLFVSLKSSLNMTLKDIYDSLFKRLGEVGYAPRRQNVSVGITLGNFNVDVTPARRQDQVSSYHSLYSNRSGTWLQTNVNEHIRAVFSDCRKSS